MEGEMALKLQYNNLHISLDGLPEQCLPLSGFDFCTLSSIQNIIIFVFIVIIVVLILGFLFYSCWSEIVVLHRQWMKKHALKKRQGPKVISSPIPLSVNPYT
ncbi:hypothetical protein WA577_000947, partial [Blastocystis sp. JDR]